VTFPSSLE